MLLTGRNPQAIKRRCNHSGEFSTTISLINLQAYRGHSLGSAMTTLILALIGLQADSSTLLTGFLKGFPVAAEISRAIPKMLAQWPKLGVKATSKIVSAYKSATSLPTSI